MGIALVVLVVLVTIVNAVGIGVLVAALRRTDARSRQADDSVGAEISARIVEQRAAPVAERDPSAPR